MKYLYYQQVVISKIKSAPLNLLFHLQLWLSGARFKRISTINGIPYLRIHPQSKVLFGNDVQLNNKDNVGWYANCRIQTLRNSQLIIGNNVGISSSLIFCANSIYIGNYVKIGGGTRIFDTDFHNMKSYKERRIPQTDGPNATTKPIIIENDVFIGTNCIIGKGVTIGARSIIAAGSVVVKSIPSDEVWGGNPAKFIKFINI